MFFIAFPCTKCALLLQCTDTGNHVGMNAFMDDGVCVIQASECGRAVLYVPVLTRTTLILP